VQETTRAETWLFSALNAAPALAGGRIYQGVAPPTATSPFITFELIAGTDLVEVGAARVWSNLLYLVKGVAQGSSFAPLVPIADGIDARLNDKTGDLTDARVLGCRREEPHALSEVTDAGVSYRHLGGLFRLYVQAK